MSITTSPTATVVHLSDDPAYTALMDELDGRLDESKLTVLDFSNVKYVNSTNLARLLRTRQLAVQADRKVVLRNVGAMVLGILEATSITKLFEITTG